MYQGWHLGTIHRKFNHGRLAGFLKDFTEGSAFDRDCRGRLRPTIHNRRHPPCTSQTPRFITLHNTRQRLKGNRHRKNTYEINGVLDTLHIVYTQWAKMKLPALRAVPGSFAAVGAFLQKLFRLYDIFVHYRSEYVDNLLRKPPRLSHPPAALFFLLHSSINMNCATQASCDR